MISFIVLSYSLYLLLAASHSVLPPAAFHGTMNALWRVPILYLGLVMSMSIGARDVAEVMLASLVA